MYRPIPHLAAEHRTGVDESLRRAALAIPLLRGLGPSIDSLLDGARVRPFRRGDHLVVEGARNGHVLFVLAGVVKTQRACVEGRELILDIVGAGQPAHLPLEADAGASTLTVTALTSGEALEVRAAAFFQAIERSAAFGLVALRASSERLAAAHARLAEIAGNPVETRTVRLILRLASRFGSRANGAGVTIGLPLSRQDIADLVGTTLETAIRTMSKLARTGLAFTTKDGLVIPDAAALRARADGRRGDASTWIEAA